MKMKSAFVLSTLLVSAAQLAVAGDITGTVTISGNVPAEKEITPLNSDPTCGKLHTEKVSTSFYKVGPNKELGDVIVMLKGVSGKSTGASAAPAVLDQKGCLY